MAVSLNIESHETGTVPGAGSFACLDCGTAIVLTSIDELPHCSACGGSRFRRASLFEHASPHDHPTAETQIATDSDIGTWLDEVRAGIEGVGHFVAYQSDDGVEVLPLEEGWTRIGRSATADIRLDDPTVSRRHALLVRQEGNVRVLDDRSLNGVFVNGDQVDWRTLEDGDELAIGRYRLHLFSI
jgi:hypothetical protein